MFQIVKVAGNEIMTAMPVTSVAVSVSNSERRFSLTYTLLIVRRIHKVDKRCLQEVSSADILPYAHSTLLHV